MLTWLSRSRRCDRRDEALTQRQLPSPNAAERRPGERAVAGRGVMLLLFPCQVAMVPERTGVMRASMFLVADGDLLSRCYLVVLVARIEMLLTPYLTLALRAWSEMNDRRRARAHKHRAPVGSGPAAIGDETLIARSSNADRPDATRARRHRGHRASGPGPLVET